MADLDPARVAEIAISMLDQFAQAMKLARKDGRLRYIWGGKIHLRPEATGNFLCVGAESWAKVEDGRWVKHTFEVR